MGSDRAPVIRFEVEPWSAQVSADLGRVPSSGLMMQGWADAVARGRSQLLGIYAGRPVSNRIGSLVWEVSEDGRALDLLAVGARPVPGLCLAKVCRAKFAAFAAALGVPVIRCETRRPGLVRLMQRDGCRVRQRGDVWEIEARADG